MSRTENRVATRSPAEPRFLWAEVVRTRDVLNAQRGMPFSTTSWIAKEALLGALEAYACSLSERRLPVPPALRDELRLRRLMR